MKKTFIIIAVFISLLTKVAFSQNLIAVQNGGSPVFYTKLDSAIFYAQDHDTLFISGGPYTISVDINKELHLIGVGNNPDSTATTYQTKIYTTINVVSGSNHSSFEGLYLTGNFNSGSSTSNEDVDDIKISRCYCETINLSRLSTNWSITENIINGNIIGMYFTNELPYAQNNFISNNIIGGQITSFGYGNVFKNNDFLADIYNYVYGWHYSTFDGLEGCLVENNIFLMGGYFTNMFITSCVFNNNLFLYNWSVPSYNIGNNNIVNQPQSSIFINQTGFSFNYAHDYHLQPGSPGKNAGKDGTDIGIYGGPFPWKEGSVPFNPHFQTINIAPTTDPSGNLNVNIKVAAQDQ